MAKIWAASKLEANGEIGWYRILWDEMMLPEQWMLLASYSKWGKTFEDIEDANKLGDY